MSLFPMHHEMLPYYLVQNTNTVQSQSCQAIIRRAQPQHTWTRKCHMKCNIGQAIIIVVGIYLDSRFAS